MLAADPVSKHFNRHQEAELREELEAMAKGLIVYEIHDPEELMLDKECRTRIGGYRLSQIAFQRICHLTCTRIFDMLNDLSGVDRSERNVRSDYSVEEAVWVYNQVVRRRFESRLEKHFISRDSRTGTIVGIIGPKHSGLRLLDVYQQVIAQIMVDGSKTVKFLEADLNDRWLLLRYYSPKTVALTTADKGERDRFVEGYHFSYREVNGSSVRSAKILVRERGMTCSMWPIYDIRQGKPNGKSYKKELQSNIERVISFPFEEELDFNARISYMKEQLLGVGKTDPVAEDDRRTALAGQMSGCLKGTYRHVFIRAVRSMLARGSYDAEPLTSLTLFREAVSKRTLYDLFNAVTREAKKLPIDMREMVEHVAWKLLCGRIVIR
jgi:hypothetical protein